MYFILYESYTYPIIIIIIIIIIMWCHYVLFVEFRILSFFFLVHGLSPDRIFEMRHDGAKQWSRNWWPFYLPLFVCLSFSIFNNFLKDQELPTLPEHLSSPAIISEVRVTQSLILCVCFVHRCLSFCIFFFFWPLCCLFFFDIRILIAPLVSSNSS